MLRPAPWPSRSARLLPPVHFSVAFSLPGRSSPVTVMLQSLVALPQQPLGVTQTHPKPFLLEPPSSPQGRVLPCPDGSKKTTWIGGLHQETDVPRGPGEPKSETEMASCPALVGALLLTGGRPRPSLSAVQSETPPFSSSYRDANPAGALTPPHLSPVPVQRPHLHTQPHWGIRASGHEPGGRWGGRAPAPSPQQSAPGGAC